MNRTMQHSLTCKGGEHHYRLTRPTAYSEHTPGHKDASARQGYYTDACCEWSATLNIQERIESDEPLDVELWDQSRYK